MAEEYAGPEINEVIAFRACSRYLRSAALVVVERTDGANTVARIDGQCPVHKTTACLETYYAAGHVARWTWAGWRKWRRARREVR